MKRQNLMLIILSLILGFVTGCSDKDTQHTKLDPNLPVIAMSDLVQQADKYAGKTITVTGLFGGMCSDGADFYFKDKLELIEVIPPVDGMPTGIVIGTPLKVQGVVLVQAEHDEEVGEKESEMKIQATVIQTNRS